MAGRSHPVVRIVGHPQLRRLAVAFGLFAIAENATWIAITVFAFTRGGVGEAGLVAVVQLAPAVAVAPFAAYAGDRFRKDVVLVVGYAVQAVTMLATAAAMWGDAPGLIVYAAATSAAVAVTFTRPAVGSLLPIATTTPTDLTAANVTMGVLQFFGAFAGPAIAGLLLRGDGEPALVFASMGVALVVAALLVCRLGLDRTMVHSEAAVGTADVIHDALGGFRTLRSDADLRLLVGVASLGALVVGACDVLVVAVASGLFDESQPARAGLFGAAFGLGALLGALGSVAFVGRTKLAVPLAIAVGASGGAMAMIAAMSHVAPVVLLFVLCGTGESLSSITASSLVQRFAPANVLSRVFGVLEGLEMAAIAAGAAAASLLANWLGLRAGLLVLGLIVPALVVAAAPRLRRIDAAAPSPRPELVELVLGIPMLARLSPPTLERLLAGMEAHEIDAGAVVVRQGDEGDRYYVVERGELTVSVDGKPARTLGPGSGFGEIALVRDVPRTATITAITPTLLHSVRRADFLTALSGHPAGLGAARDHAQRLLDDDVERGDPPSA